MNNDTPPAQPASTTTTRYETMLPAANTKKQINVSGWKWSACFNVCMLVWYFVGLGWVAGDWAHALHFTIFLAMILGGFAVVECFSLSSRLNRQPTRIARASITNRKQEVLRGYCCRGGTEPCVHWIQYTYEVDGVTYEHHDPKVWFVHHPGKKETNNFTTTTTTGSSSSEIIVIVNGEPQVQQQDDPNVVQVAYLIDQPEYSLPLGGFLLESFPVVPSAGSLRAPAASLCQRNMMVFFWLFLVPDIALTVVTSRVPLFADNMPQFLTQILARMVAMAMACGVYYICRMKPADQRQRFTATTAVKNDDREMA